MSAGPSSIFPVALSFAFGLVVPFAAGLVVLVAGTSPRLILAVADARIVLTVAGAAPGFTGAFAGVGSGITSKPERPVRGARRGPRHDTSRRFLKCKFHLGRRGGRMLREIQRCCPCHDRRSR